MEHASYGLHSVSAIRLSSTRKVFVRGRRDWSEAARPKIDPHQQAKHQNFAAIDEFRQVHSTRIALASAPEMTSKRHWTSVDGFVA